MKTGERFMLDGHLWKSEYSEIPLGIKEDLKRRLLYAYLNYRYAKQKVEYFTTLSSKGLNPHAMLPESGYVYLSSALLNDVVVSTYLLVDRDPESNGLLGFRRTIRRYATEYPILKIPKIEGDILNSSDIKKLQLSRNNIVAHSNKDILKHLEDNQLDDNFMNNCLTEIYKIIQTINDTYFDSDITEEHNLTVDTKFIDNLIRMFKSS